MSYYSKQLKDNKWQTLRLKIISRDKHKCTKCNTTDKLVVHHLYYVYGHKPWQYPHSALITLCTDCHTDWHNKYDVVVRPAIADKSYKPIKRQKTKNKVIKELVGYKISKGDLKTIAVVMKNLSYKEKQKYIKVLQTTYEKLR